MSQPALRHAVPFITVQMGKKWREGWTKTKMLSEQLKRIRHFIRGFSGHEQQGKEHRHAGHAGQLNLYTHTGAL